MLDRARAAIRRPLGGSSEADPLYPQSSGPTLSAQALPSDNPADAIKVIWGTNVSILESMTVFGDFLRNFKPKYRTAWDRKNGVATVSQPSPESGERLLYLNYLRKMRLTTQTNLNLDAVNLEAYPPTQKLYIQLQKYPQELIPIMDQVLKDTMISLAEEDADREAAGGHQDDITQEEINDMAGRIYMVRPFGFPPVNMRQLNPSGRHYSRSCTNMILTVAVNRYGQAVLYQGPCHSCHPCNP